jgi:outer membrane protein
MNKPQNDQNMKKVFYSILFVLLIACLGLSIYNYIQTPKWAFVRTGELIKGYAGMNEAKDRYDEKIKGWEANLDTLKSDYVTTLKAYEKDKGSLGIKQKTVREHELRALLENVQKYNRAVEEMSAEEDSKLTERVYAQINTYIIEYGKEKGYDLIFGTNNSGNIMYGKDVKDITKEVLVGLNKKYEGVQ